MSESRTPPDAAWSDVAPELDEAVNELGNEDRQAILLRFFEQENFRQIGAVLGVSEDAAHKRVSRALDKLREALLQRGVTLSAALLGATLGRESVVAAPAGLAQRVGGEALKGAPVATGALTILTGSFALWPVKAGFTALLLTTAVVLWPSKAPPPPRQPTALQKSTATNRPQALVSMPVSSQRKTVSLGFAPQPASPESSVGPIAAAETLAPQGEWGRVEGVYASDGKPLVNVQLQLDATNGWRSANPMEAEIYRATTDSDGQFAFATVPPSRYRLVRLVPNPDPSRMSWTHQSLGEIDVVAGETTMVRLGGNTYQFAGTLRWPQGFQKNPNECVHLSLLPPDTILPPLGSPITGGIKVTLLNPISAESWMGNELNPGRYLVQALVVGQPDFSRPPVFIGRGTTHVDVPALPSTVAIQLGTIPIQIAPSPIEISAPSPPRE